MAIATLPTLDQFIGDLARALAQPGDLDVRVLLIRDASDVAALLAWTNEPGDVVWFEFCWPPFPDLIARTDFADRQVIVRVHRIEAYEASFVARTDWSRVHDLIVVSSDMARVVREELAGTDHRTRLHVVHNGVDTRRVIPISRFEGHRIGWCGNFVLRKNPALALQILSVLRAEDHRYILRLAAGTADRITLESFHHQARALGVSDAIRFEGKVSAEDMPAWHAGNDILLSTSLHESFGYAIAEAAAAGCDIAVFDHRGAEEFWPAQTRFATVEQAARLLRDSAPHRWSATIGDRFSLARQVRSVLGIVFAGQSP